jgi:hypothetical protein
VRVNSSGSRAILLVILLAALAWRLAGCSRADRLRRDRASCPISASISKSRGSFLAGDGFSFTDPRFTDRVYAYRTPGYPLLLAACRADVRAVRIVQAVIDTLTVLAAYLLARRALPPLACVFAAALVAFNPFLIYFCGLLLSETLFTAMLAWGTVLLLRRSTLAGSAAA